jgi:hypothetical protein
LPLENLVLRDDGFVRLLTAFNTQRCLNPSISLGLAEGAFEEAVRYARNREAFGRPIGAGVMSLVGTKRRSLHCSATAAIGVTTDMPNEF